MKDYTAKDLHRIYNLLFSSVYPLYIAKVERKWKTKSEVDQIIMWLTGYDIDWIQDQIDRKSTFEEFFVQAPALNPNASKITGLICGYRIEDIDDDLVRKVRYLDKLIDELAKGRPMDKILRK